MSSDAESAAGGPALDVAAGLGAAGFAALVLWTLPPFLSLPAGGATVAVVAGAAAVAYAVAGPHPAEPRQRAMVAAAAAATLAAAVLVRLALPGGPSAVAGFLPAVVTGLGSWGSGAGGTLAQPAATVMAGVLGLAVALPVFHAARVGRPALALLLGFALLVVEWEFVYNATVHLFWPLVAVALFWLAADRARETGRTVAHDVGSPTPWTAFGMAGLASTLILLALFVVPRQGGPANLGRLGVWIDHLPVIGTMEKSTREGSLGYGGPGGGAAGSSQHPGIGSSTPSLRQDGFSLAQTGFTTDVAHLGGPAAADDRVALDISVSGGGAGLSNVYLRGAVRDRYDGSGWLADPSAEAPDPSWPTDNAGTIGRDFLRGATLPAPYTEVSARIRLLDAPGANLFTILLPLRLSVQDAQWDSSGEVWVSTAPPSGYTYSLSAAVLPPNVYAGTALAAYSSPAARNRLLSPQQAAALLIQGTPVRRVREAVTAAPTGALPLASDLEVPPTVPPRVRSLARSWTAPVSGDPLLEALVIQQELAQSYTYTLQAPVPPRGSDFVDYFLFDARRGYCTSFSTAMAVMLRTLGIPTRWVEGYRANLPGGAGDYLVRDDAAHAWVEAYIQPFGWLTFDPTPGAVVSATPAGASSRGGPSGLARWVRGAGFRWWTLLLLPAVSALTLAAGAVSNVLAERRPADSPAQEAAAIWQACERVATRFGRRRHQAETPAEYAAELGRRFRPAVAAAAASMAEDYGVLRYGPAGAPGGGWPAAARMKSHWQQLQSELREAAPWTYPFRRWL